MSHRFSGQALFVPTLRERTTEVLTTERVSTAVIQRKNMKINIQNIQDLSSSPKDEVKDKIMSWFKKSNSDVGHVMDERNLLQSIYMKLNPKQKNVLEEAIDELVQNDLIEIKNDKLLVLTEKGVDLIYLSSSPKNEVKDKIMSWFKKSNSDVGDVMDERNLLQSIYMKLNPKQKNVFDEAIEELVQNEFITIKDEKLLVLTEKGVDSIF